MNDNVDHFIQARDRARQAGDRGLEAAISADLARLGYQETTAVALPERAVPAPKRTRRPAARCEHGRTAGRCQDCNQEAA
jgi:hypothetical protein